MKFEVRFLYVCLLIAAIKSTLTSSQQCTQQEIIGALSTQLPSYESRAHPFKPEAKVWGSLQAPYPTNSFFSNIFINTSVQFPFMPYPFHVKVRTDDIQVSAPFRRATKDFILETFVPNIAIGAIEQLEMNIQSYDLASVTVQWKRSDSEFMRSPIVRGSPYVTMEYNNLTPELNTIHAILSVNGNTFPGQVSGKSFFMEFNNGQWWKIYVLNNKEITLTWDRNTMRAASKFSGVLRATMVRDRSLIGIFDSSSEVYPVASNIQATFCPSNLNEAFINFNWVTRGTAPASSLLMFALPHQMDSMVSPNIVIPDGAKTIKGKMTGVLGEKWVLKETLTQIGFSAPREIDSNKKALIKSALEREKNKRAGSFDTYWNGKELAAMGRLALIADELGEADLARHIRGNLKSDIDKWFFGNNSNPLIFDSSWKGICTWKGMLAPENDFGQGYYNDHHFHYGYFIYAAAALGKGDRGWLNERKEKVISLLRDYANPSTLDEHFPVTRNKDWFDGHSWAAGLFPFGDSKNQESTSESVNAYYAIHLLGESLQDSKLSMWGRLLLATELRSVKKYWHIKKNSDIYEPVFADNKIVGVLWSSKVDYTTFFGNNTEYIHGIQMLPFTPITEELLPADFVREEYPVLATALTRPSPAIADDWKAFVYLDHAIIDKEAAWNEVQTLRFFDNGNTMTNSLYFVATRP